MLGEWLATTAPPLEGLHCRGLRRGLFRHQLVFAQSRLGILELHFQLVEKAGLTFRARAVKFASELLDLQRQMRDERLGAGDFCLDPRRIRNGLVATALGQISAPFRCRKRGFQKGDIIRRGSHDGGL